MIRIHSDFTGGNIRILQQNGDEYILVRVEDETGKAEELCDKDISRAQYYKRGTIGNLTLNIEVGKYTNIRIIDFQITS